MSAAGALAGWLYYDDTCGGGGIYWREVASVYSDQADAPPAADSSPAPPAPAPSELADALPPEPAPISIRMAKSVSTMTGGWVSERAPRLPSSGFCMASFIALTTSVA